jgi:hypothetical protein
MIRFCVNLRSFVQRSGRSNLETVSTELAERLRNQVDVPNSPDQPASLFQKQRDRIQEQDPFNIPPSGRVSGQSGRYHLSRRNGQHLQLQGHSQNQPEGDPMQLEPPNNTDLACPYLQRLSRRDPCLPTRTKPVLLLWQPWTRRPPMQTEEEERRPSKEQHLSDNVPFTTTPAIPVLCRKLFEIAFINLAEPNKR